MNGLSSIKIESWFQKSDLFNSYERLKLAFVKSSILINHEQVSSSKSLYDQMNLGLAFQLSSPFLSCKG